MRINEIVWLDAVVDKLAAKHGVETDEVEEVFVDKPKSDLCKEEIELVRTFMWRWDKRKQVATLPSCSFTSLAELLLF